MLKNRGKGNIFFRKSKTHALTGNRTIPKTHRIFLNID
jgi:hypothetical protein